MLTMYEINDRKIFKKVKIKEKSIKADYGYRIDARMEIHFRQMLFNRIEARILIEDLRRSA